MVNIYNEINNVIGSRLRLAAPCIITLQILIQTPASINSRFSNVYVAAFTYKYDRIPLATIPSVPTLRATYTNKMHKLNWFRYVRLFV